MYAGCGAQGDHLMPSQNHRISCGALGDLGEQVHHRFGLVGSSIIYFHQKEVFSYYSSLKSWALFCSYKFSLKLFINYKTLPLEYSLITEFLMC